MIGFFKKGKSAKPKGNPKKKGKVKGGDAISTEGFIQSMGLQESVASMVVDELQESEVDSSLVREISDGYLVLALTEDALKASGVSVKDEQFGSFSESISSEHIKTIVLADSLSSGVLGIVPSFDTLDILDEYEFLQGTEFTWAIVPYDADDESELVLTEETSTLEQIMDMAYGDTPLPDVVGSDSDLDEQGHDITFDDVDIDEDEDDDDIPLDDDELVERHDDFDDLVDDELLDESYDGVQPTVSLYDEPVTDNDVDEGDVSFDSYYEPTNDDERVADVSVMDDVSLEQEVGELTVRTFYNDELGLSVNLDAFDMHFDNMTTNMPLFDETVTDDSELSANLVNMRRDANIELLRYRSKHMQELRSQFGLLLSTAHDKLVEVLDYRSADTTVGKKFKEIERDRYGELSDADSILHIKRKEMKTEYEKRRDDVARQAANVAKEKFDAIHRPTFDAERQSLEELVRSQIEVDADLRVSKLHAERKELAQRLYDKSITMALRELQDAFTEMSHDEMEMYDTFRKRLDHYLRNNYTNEVLRAQAIAEQQRQSNEAVLLKQRYDAMLAQKQGEVEAADMKATNRLRELESQQSASMKEARGDFERRLEEYKQRNTMLENSVNSLQKDLTKMDELKSNEFKNQLRSKDDIIASQREQLSYAEERASKTSKTSGGVLASFVSVALVLGIGCGVAIGAMTAGSNETPVVQQQQPQPQQTFVIPGYTQAPVVTNETNANTIGDSNSKTDDVADAVIDGKKEDAVDTDVVDKKETSDNVETNSEQKE